MAAQEDWGVRVGRALGRGADGPEARALGPRGRNPSGEAVLSRRPPRARRRETSNPGGPSDPANLARRYPPRRRRETSNPGGPSDPANLARRYPPRARRRETSNPGGPSDPANEAPLTCARLRQWAPPLVLVVAFAAVSIVVVPRVRADGSARGTTYDLDAAAQTPAFRARGQLVRNVYGFQVPAFSSGAASFAFSASSPRAGERTILFVIAGAGHGVSTR